eukprot:ANDGO_02942.mRNA.1 hypothetical protein
MMQPSSSTPLPLSILSGSQPSGPPLSSGSLVSASAVVPPVHFSFSSFVAHCAQSYAVHALALLSFWVSWMHPTTADALVLDPGALYLSSQGWWTFVTNIVCAPGLSSSLWSVSFLASCAMLLASSAVVNGVVRGLGEGVVGAVSRVRMLGFLALCHVLASGVTFAVVLVLFGKRRHMVVGGMAGMLGAACVVWRAVMGPDGGAGSGIFLFQSASASAFLPRFRHLPPLFLAGQFAHSIVFGAPFASTVCLFLAGASVATFLVPIPTVSSSALGSSASSATAAAATTATAATALGWRDLVGLFMLPIRAPDAMPHIHAAHTPLASAATSSRTAKLRAFLTRFVIPFRRSHSHSQSQSQSQSQGQSQGQNQNQSQGQYANAEEEEMRAVEEAERRRRLAIRALDQRLADVASPDDEYEDNDDDFDYA